MEHTVANSVAKRRAIAAIQSEVASEELQKIRKHNDTKHVEGKHGLATSGTGHGDPPPSTQAQGGRPKDNSNHGRSERKKKIPDASAENSVEDVSNNGNIMPQETTEE